jgi:3-isopropylmalate/(R)-2-methylmalate dehydratase large subunit
MLAPAGGGQARVAARFRDGTDYAPIHWSFVKIAPESVMSIDLMSLRVEKRPREMRFEGRVLFLVDDAALMRAQLEQGADLELTSELKSKLRDQISTDEITPAYICYYFDETLGDFPYLGLRAGGEFPVRRGSTSFRGASTVRSDSRDARASTTA